MVLLDADGQHRVEDVPELVRPILDNSADITVGNRFADDRTQVPPLRKAAQHGLTWLSNKGSGIELSDSQCGMRAFSRTAIKSLLLQSTSMAAASEMQFLASDAQLRVREVPIEVRYFGDRKRSTGRAGPGRPERHHRADLATPTFALLRCAWSDVVAGRHLLRPRRCPFAQYRILLVGQLLVSVAVAIIGTLSLFTAVVLNALGGIRAELRSHR